MTAVPDVPRSTELAELRGELMTLLTRIEGDVRLVLHQIEQGARRADELDRRVERLDERMDQLESTRATREDLAERSRRTVQIISLIVSTAGLMLTGLITVITALIK